LGPGSIPDTLHTTVDIRNFPYAYLGCPGPWNISKGVAVPQAAGPLQKVTAMAVVAKVEHQYCERDILNK
jgi:hypothetical protein